MKGAVTGALVFEGLAKISTRRLSWRLPGRSPSRRARARLCGIDGGRHLGLDVYAIVKNKTYGNIAYTNMSEQMARFCVWALTTRA